MPKRKAAPSRREQFKTIEDLYHRALPFLPNFGYLDEDCGQTERKRQKVVKYIGELQEDFGLEQETTVFAVNYFDRWESLCNERRRRKWQLHLQTVERMLFSKMGAFCASHVVSFLDQQPPSWHEIYRRSNITSCVVLLFAAKFYDTHHPNLAELVQIVNQNSLHWNVEPTDADEMTELELKIIDGLDWRLNVITPAAFVPHLLRLCDPDYNEKTKTSILFDPEQKVMEKIMFFVDLVPYCYTLLQYHPCVHAAAAILLGWEKAGQRGTCRKYLDLFLKASHSDKNTMNTTTKALDDLHREAMNEG